MITNYNFERKTWPILSYEYTSPAELKAGEFAAFTEGLFRGIIASPLAGEKPEDPDEVREWLPGAMERFASMYKDVTYAIICDCILTPVGDAPKIDDIYAEASSSPNGFAQLYAVANFFLNSVQNNSLLETSLGRSGEGIVLNSLANQLKASSQSNTKTGSSLPRSRGRANSKTTRKAFK